MRKVAVRWNLLIILAVLISIIFFVRSYYFPQYYVYILLPEGKWLYALCGAVSVCFTIIYFMVLVRGRERIGEKVYFFIRLYTVMLLVVGFLKNSPYSGYSGLDKIFMKLLYYSMEPPLDFWDFLSSFAPVGYRYYSFACISAGYCLAAGNIMINQSHVTNKKYLNILFSYSYLTYIICHRIYYSDIWNILKVVMGMIYVLLWIIAILKMKADRHTLKKFQIFWLIDLCAVFIVFIGELPQFTFNRVIALISDLTIFKAFSWPLFMFTQVSYILRAIIYFGVLISINILCLVQLKKND